MCCKWGGTEGGKRRHRNARAVDALRKGVLHEVLPPDLSYQASNC